MAIAEPIYLEYGRCPNCGKACQPDGESDEYENVACCDCRIAWTLYHDDPTDPRDGTELWREYRIGDIESFDDMLVTPYECKDTEDNRE